ncbi:hypothetical protein VTG60DRAFT_6530 [Thermothelomyces hinnuleus]
MAELPGYLWCTWYVNVVVIMRLVYGARNPACPELNVHEVGSGSRDFVEFLRPGLARSGFGLMQGTHGVASRHSRLPPETSALERSLGPKRYYNGNGCLPLHEPRCLAAYQSEISKSLIHYFAHHMRNRNPYRDYWYFSTRAWSNPNRGNHTLCRGGLSSLSVINSSVLRYGATTLQNATRSSVL